MELLYEWNGDFLIPNLVANEEPKESLLRYGQMRMRFLKENRSATFTAMKLKGTLKTHCLDIQKEAEEMEQRLMEQMKKKEGIKESWKNTDQMRWVREMNSIKHRAEEIVKNDLIYV